MAGHAALAASLLRFAYPRLSPARRRTLMRWWSAKLLRILNVSARVEGRVPRGAEAAMIAANHVSWLDIFVISSMHPTRFIAKSEIRDWPVAGWIAQEAGTLFVRRAEWRDTARTARRVHDALAAGDCVGLFPEGITTEGDTLLKFHSSLFEAAVSNKAWVHPAALRYESPQGELCREVSFIGERTFMESLGLIIRQEAVTVRIRFAEPVHAHGATRREVAAHARQRVASLLGLDPEDTAPGRGAGR
ncbi:MAG: lysophospholipid acyltransferase family protein [Usitatibacter sp.]